jgi:uncharacterized protein YfaS (alpha-2-macroglobulin family)
MTEGIMKKRLAFLSAILILFSTSHFAHAGEEARVELFSPQGMVKQIRQVTARFSDQVVSFGDPRLEEPFEIICPEKGRGRWADGKNWVYDFDRDVPAGVICTFALKQDMKTLSGNPFTGQKQFSFSTGGPSIIESYPKEGSQRIDEDQIFILKLDAEAQEESVLSHVSCSIEGINEVVGINTVKGEKRERILKQFRQFKDSPQILAQCRQSFPNGANVRLVWGKGVASLTGIKTTEDQVLAFKVREPFAAKFRCERENAKADCIPLLPVRLNFTAPVPWNVAKKIIFKGNNRVYKPGKEAYIVEDGEEGEGEIGTPPAQDENFVYGVSFKGPFPENTSFVMELPNNFKDDAGRTLSNRDKFPLTVRTDAYPPLAKFSARFGIIELKGDATLPVTLRNLEPEVRTKMLKVEKGKEGIVDKAKEGLLEKAVKMGEAADSIMPDALKGKNQEVVEGLKGRLHKIRLDREEKVIEWLKRIAAVGRESTIFKGDNGIKEFTVPKPGGTKAFEVVGVPLKDAGFYVVEMESRLLGSSLLGEQKPVFVPTAALITNLTAHFKWGRESSLVWVTSLDKAEPVKDASVTIRDCNGKVVWKGKTDEDGIARIRKKLPLMKDLPHSSINMNYQESTPALQRIGGGLFIFASTSKDMTFVHSSWDEGIEQWRYSLPPAEYTGPTIAHTVFDRSLVRAGETVHMKHIIRKHAMSGFSLLTDAEIPKTVSIQHQGSDQRYEFPLKWDKKGIAETEWRIPKEAKLGHYSVFLLRKASGKPRSRTAVGGYSEGDEEYIQADGWNSGQFRVEEFKVPLMKAVIRPPREPLINAKEAELDLLLAYLSGGGAGNTGVKLRSQIQPKNVNFEDYEGFSFANGEVKEELLRRTRYEAEEEESRARKPVIQTKELLLDRNGSIRTKIAELPAVSQPSEILTELEFKDPNGETQTASQRIPLWPSGVVVGIKPDSWASSKDNLKFHVVVLDLSGKPVENKEVKVELFLRKSYSHRKRLVGGYYSYENVRETKKVGPLCEGKTDARGLVICETKSSRSGNVILQAKTADDAGNTSLAHRDIWIAGKGEWWFEASDHDRIDLLPEKKRYEPGDTAKFQVRMPFRNATALVSVEREGIIETFVKKISGKTPVIEIPIRKNYAPNVFVSALVVRGRISNIQPTAMVDLGKPAFKLGIAEINVGWKAYELKVNVTPEKAVYKIREKAKVHIGVKRANGDLPPVGSEVVIAAVDEGLLELMPNRSWKLIEAMMARRGYEVQTATAQMQVVGKRHYGLKAQPQGGGGGRQATRELFDTLLLWKARVPLNKKGEAAVEFPLNDSLTSFRIVAVANGGTGMFGTGQTSIRSTQDLMILSGIPQVVREGDRFRAGFTIRNASDRKMEVEVKVAVKDPEKKELDPVTESLSPGEAKEIGWDIKAPMGTDSLSYEVAAMEKGGEAFDKMNVKQKVAEAVPVRTFQATLAQVEDSTSMDIEKPSDALPGKGGIQVSLKPRLSDGLGGVIWFMKQYPYTCMEQKTSRAVALRDEELWKNVIAELPAHLDSDGLVKYFPSMLQGSDVLTSYIVSIAHEAGWEIPADIKDRMQKGLKGFIEGRVIRYGSLPTADLSIRKMAALEALARAGQAESRLLGPIALNPNLWPTSAVIDWTSVLLRMNDIPDREKKLKEAEQILRARINFQGTTMGFSTEGTDQLWWLMVSADLNAVKSILTLLHIDGWNQDMPRLVRGALGRQYRGAWNLTTANAWGILAMEKFSKKFEAVPVSGAASATLNDKTKSVEWSRDPEGKVLNFSWPKGKERLTIEHMGKGKPWSTVQSLAAIPLKEPFSSGFRIKKTLIPVEQKIEGKWSKGDVARVRLELEAEADMTWVVVNDPIPAGSSILGTGLGRDSQLLTAGEKREGWVWPAFEERSFEAFRAYYEFVPKGRWTVEYTIRFNNDGTFHLPATRVEALYAPEMLGEIPNKTLEVER